MHRAYFAEAVKRGKAEKLKHLMQYGQQDKTKSRDIYHKTKQEFMLAIKRIKENDVNFESSWAGLSDKQVIAEMIKLATAIVWGEYDKKWGIVAAEKVVVAVKKVVLKKTVRKAVRKK